MIKQVRGVVHNGFQSEARGDANWLLELASRSHEYDADDAAWTAPGKQPTRVNPDRAVLAYPSLRHPAG